VSRRFAVAILGVAGGPLAGCDLVFAPGGLPPGDAGQDAEECPGTYVAVDGAPSQYRIVESPMLPWLEAEGACEADTVSGETHLVVFDDYLELAALREHMVPLGGYTAHVGYGRDAGDQPDMFTAVTGEPLSSASNLWEPGEPTGGTEQVVFFTSIEDLTDGPHAMARIYVCECDGRRPTKTFSFP
jgi:hypothetical protein